MIYDLLIVGAGPAGLYTWKLATNNNFTGYIIDSNASWGGQPLNSYPEKLIKNIPGFKDIKAIDFIKNMYDAIDKDISKINLKLNTFIINIEKNVIENKNFYEVEFSDNIKMKFKFIILCEGYGKYKIKKINNENYKNLIYTIKDIDQFNNKKVVVFGGGDSAIDWANKLVEHASEVSIVHRREEFRGSSSGIEQLKSKGGKVFTPYELNNFIFNENKIIEKVKINSTIDKNIVTTIDCDYAIVQYGTEIEKTSHDYLNLQRNYLLKIIVDKNMETSCKNIYAVGDCNYYEGKMRNIPFSFAESSRAVNTIENIIHKKNGNLGW